MTHEQINLLHHTLGLRVDRRDPWRNHFVAGPGHHDMPDLEALEAAGLMRRGRTPGFCNPSDIVFMATEAGQALALEKLPEPPPPKKKTQHRQWLDADSGYSFGQWLCGHQLPKVEREETHHLVDGRYRCTPRYRMYRLEKNSQWRRDVEGQWATTKKEAKASYKAALAARRAKAA
ncbi:hypothetical protein [Acidovorax sp. NCPPB 4044]|uniref:hypothetical protein n=1 Tax=Acidovorax sp. NCPPB 4044 TaxID=2940490 RepID=UPI00230225B6|nr:hypothetical protein [Acidovorax sp. NCPPB 4044]MDA8522018.1 hypothetical protein [Acidovorax sp. NCPPB 4044]